MSKMVNTSDLKFSRRIYPRTDIYEPQVTLFARLMEEDRGYVRFAPIVAIRESGEILDGVHRYLAAKKAGLERVPVDWEPDPGTPEAAKARAAEMNIHGRPLRDEERKAIVFEFVKRYRDLSVEDVRTLARQLGVTVQMVANWKAQAWDELNVTEKKRQEVVELVTKQGKTVREAAEAVGMSKSAVDRIVRSSPERHQEQYPLMEGERFSRIVDGVPYFVGRWGPDCPPDLVEYTKDPVTGVIDVKSPIIERWRIGPAMERILQSLRWIGYLGAQTLLVNLRPGDAEVVRIACATLEKVYPVLRAKSE